MPRILQVQTETPQLKWLSKIQLQANHQRRQPHKWKMRRDKQSKLSPSLQVFLLLWFKEALLTGQTLLRKLKKLKRLPKKSLLRT